MSKTDLYFQKPYMNAAGTLGFSPDLKGRIEIQHLGAFITNPVSQQARTPARGERTIKFPGGFLLHTGYPNPGLKAVIRDHAKRWSGSPVPIIVHLLAQEPGVLGKMIERLEGLEGVMGVEIGLAPGTDRVLVHDLVQSALGELTIIVRLPFEMVVESYKSNPVLEIIGQAGVNAVSLAPPRGVIPGGDGTLVSGRLYGPAQFPLIFAVVKNLTEFEIPIIAGGGVYSSSDSASLLEIGAIAVQLDTVLWRGDFQFPVHVDQV